MATLRGFLPLVMVTAVAHADVKPQVAPLVGATEVARRTPPFGFIDDPIAGDDQRLAYVVADAAEKAELHVVALGNQQETVVDLAPVTLHPVGLRLVGNRAFVVGQTEDGKQLAALVELDPKKTKVVYKVAPATGITVVTRDGKPRIAVHRATETDHGTRHEVELLALDTGKHVAGGRAFEVDKTGKNVALDFRVNHWADGMTRAIGIKGGEWDKKENQRTPDVEATYDLVAGTFTDKKPIEDLFEQRKRFGILASDAHGRLDFVRVDPMAGLQLWRAGKLTAVTLDQPLSNYDPKSLQGEVLPDGSAWIALEIDPVNPDAVARKKADPEYLDVFRVGSDGKGVRKARVLATGQRHWFGVIGDRFWLFERSSGFDRGGRSLVLYAFS